MTSTISVIVLNWNRALLLDNCIRSLVETLPDLDRCVIVDNNSADNSPDVIRRWAAADMRIRPMLKPENRGAEWINEAIGLVTSDLVLILANDKMLLPGWADYTHRVFSAFPELGQLALHAPAPLDNEVWVTKPARYRYRAGVGLFEAVGNTGMSSVLRRSLFASGEILFGNIDNGGDVKLPADWRLSTELQAKGFISAWSDRYYCLNVGHTIEEVRRDAAYYDKNYAAKPWVTQGLAQRIADYEATPKPERSSRIFGWRGDPEPTAATLPQPARVWSIVDGGGPDLETIDFLFTLCRLLKPTTTTLVRAWTGHAVVAIAEAFRDNAAGKLTCFEHDAQLQAASIARLTERGLKPSISWNIERSDDPELLIVCGHFEPADEEWAINRAAGALSSARHVVLHGEPMRSRLLTLLPVSKWTALTIPTPRLLTLLGRTGAP